MIRVSAQKITTSRKILSVAGLDESMSIVVRIVRAGFAAGLTLAAAAVRAGEDAAAAGYKLTPAWYAGSDGNDA